MELTCTRLLLRALRMGRRFMSSVANRLENKALSHVRRNALAVAAGASTKLRTFFKSLLNLIRPMRA
jgi:hypothetical protein